MSFATPVAIAGPLRKPVQMLAVQACGGNNAIDDDAKASELGFRAGPIDGPTYFSFSAPLLARIWGDAWFESGCLSTHDQNLVIEGQSVRAFAEIPPNGARETQVWSEKADGTPVPEASASLGPDFGPTLLGQRIVKLRAPGPLVILKKLRLGMTGAEELTALAGVASGGRPV
jgi:hypothetical protein